MELMELPDLVVVDIFLHLSGTDMQNVAKEGTLHQSREASKVYLTFQTVRKLGKTEVSRSQFIKCIPENDCMGL